MESTQGPRRFAQGEYSRHSLASGALIWRRCLLHGVHVHGLCGLPLHGGATGMENANDTT